MSSRSVKRLAIVVIVLFGVLYALNTTDRGPLPTENDLIVPGLKDRLNEIDSVAISSADARISIVKDGDAWTATEKDGYPAQVATLRQVLLAIADARKIEAKTSNPELYDRLGVQHPGEDGGSGKLVSASGGDFTFALILGDVAQGDYRYARHPDETGSWLIDKNPPVPEDLNDWLFPEIMDLNAARVQSVIIQHADDETIEIRKESADATAFDVDGIPPGRELSYPTIANGIAGALANLTLDDVMPVPETGMNAGTTTTFTTFDGLRIVVNIGILDEQTWLSFDASVVNATSTTETPPGDSEATAGEGSEPAGPELSESGGDEEEQLPESAGHRSTDDEAATINARTGGWLYRVAEYKSDQLGRRWEDLLKAESE